MKSRYTVKPKKKKHSTTIHFYDEYLKLFFANKRFENIIT